MPEFQTLADKGWCFSSLSFWAFLQFRFRRVRVRIRVRVRVTEPKLQEYQLLLTITICCYSKSNHIPITLGCHGNIFGYVEAQAFTYTMVSSKLLRDVLMSRYSHLCTNVNKCVAFYSLGYRLQAL